MLKRPAASRRTPAPSRPHARVMGDQAADADLEPEAEGMAPGERADHDDVARDGVAIAARDRVEDSSASLLILHFILESLEAAGPSSPPAI